MCTSKSSKKFLSPLGIQDNTQGFGQPWHKVSEKQASEVIIQYFAEKDFIQMVPVAQCRFISTWLFTLTHAPLRCRVHPSMDHPEWIIYK